MGMLTTSNCFCSPVTAKQNYKKVFLSYSHAFLCRDRDDGSLRGVTLIAVDRKPTYTVTKVTRANRETFV